MFSPFLLTRIGMHTAQVFWHLPESFCEDVLTDKTPIQAALMKHDIAFSEWLQGVGSLLDLRFSVRFLDHQVYP